MVYLHTFLLTSLLLGSEAALFGRSSDDLQDETRRQFDINDSREAIASWRSKARVKNTIESATGKNHQDKAGDRLVNDALLPFRGSRRFDRSNLQRDSVRQLASGSVTASGSFAGWSGSGSAGIAAPAQAPAYVWQPVAAPTEAEGLTDAPFEAVSGISLQQISMPNKSHPTSVHEPCVLPHVSPPARIEGANKRADQRRPARGN